MLEGLFGEGEAISTVTNNVDQNFDTPFIDRHCLMPNGLNESDLFACSSFVPNATPHELVCIGRSPHHLLKLTIVLSGGLRRFCVILLLWSKNCVASFPNPSF